jgi:hypothetical protein
MNLGHGPKCVMGEKGQSKQHKVKNIKESLSILGISTMVGIYHTHDLFGNHLSKISVSLMSPKISITLI